MSTTSPLSRAASNAVACLKTQGAPVRAVHLHSEDVDRREAPYFVSFPWRHVTSMHRCLPHWGGQQWLEVPGPPPANPSLAS